jgi:hypothetical protein
MADVYSSAERALTALCVHLVLGAGTDNLNMWLEQLRDVQCDCDHAPISMAKLINAASSVARAKTTKDLELAMNRLRFELSNYFALVAATRLEAWRKAKKASSNG